MKKKLIISFMVLLILVIILGTIFIVYAKEESISLVKDEVTIEYGNTYIPNIQELIDLKKYKFVNLNEIRIESDIQNENDKDYPAVGEYEVNVYYKKSNLKQKVKVIDTGVPEISIQENIEIECNTDLSTIDFGEYIETRDLSEQKEYRIDFSKVDSKLSGEYDAIVSIEDIYGNKAEKNFKITILEGTKEKTQEIIEEKVTTTEKQEQSNKSSGVSTFTKKTNNSKANVNTKASNTKETVKNESNSQNISVPVDNQNVKKVDLSKYSFYEKMPNGTYKAFRVEQSEINKLKNLIDISINNFGYRNTKVVLDSSLAKLGASYFTTNKINVDNAIYNSEGFSIHFYAINEYIVTSEGKETYFQTRSYITVK